MKKILSLLVFSLTIFSFWFVINNTYAAEWIKVKVTEKIPWANCGEPLYEDTTDKSRITWYECTIEKWFSSITAMLWKMIQYATFIASLGWVLFIVINGIMYSMWGIDSGWKDEAKKRIVKTLVGLILLLLSGLILYLIAPWVYQL